MQTNMQEERREDAACCAGKRKMSEGSVAPAPGTSTPATTTYTYAHKPMHTHAQSLTHVHTDAHAFTHTNNAPPLLGSPSYFTWLHAVAHNNTLLPRTYIYKHTY